MIAPSAKPDFRVEKIAAPLRQSVTESIRYAIALGRFTAGERLTERELCEMTGVSRTLVREALRQLESEGLIEVVPNRGPSVARLSAEQAEGVYQVRAELEGLACQLFAQFADNDQRAALHEAFRKLKRSFKDTDPLARLRAKNHFYDCLVDGTGNQALGDTLRLLNARIMLLRATSLRAPGRSAVSMAELSAMMEALDAKDGKKARALAEHHVHNAAKAAIELLYTQPEPAPAKPKRAAKQAAAARA
ncbi:GntR family transcriptional regulator [Undibacter mobilis]|uniref:GntR family transcriptional regulator n=1 Tax=Undibacter mobilis TaxID=2292256 RepID=A0A371B3S3_9BRAD|nr:GntR family transcriptional regulator [Undibacter mobilis]RDV02246.1 GntR family transcriptional regulator [Undibacter mobilis]